VALKGAALRLPRLKEVRELHGWSQKKLAEESGVSRDSISNYETGHRDAWPATAKKLADALDVEIADLLEPAQELSASGKGEAPATGQTYEESIEQTERRLYGYPVIARGWNRFAERWSQRLEAGDFDEDVLEELIAGLEDFAPGMEANRAAERKELGSRYAAESVLRPAIENLTLLVREALAKADAANEEQERKLVRLEDRFQRAV
jgi:putative transcriptional regulator